jgi:hypothetical protein
VPSLVTAKDGDTLCGIAMDNGFLNCDPLRAESANAPFLNRPLRAGDVVTVPDITTKKSGHATSQIHKFLKKNSPPVSIRLVHGSPDKHYLDDDTLTQLNISNYPTDKGGLEGNHAFPGGFGFNPDGHADEDTFKIEIVDPSAGGTLFANMEALRPIFKPDGSIDHHDTFAGVSDADDRKTVAVHCKEVRPGHVAFRSAYLRLVADQIDNINQQTLLITDVADAGLPEIEILDQKVRATYVVKACNAAGDAKCKVAADVPLAPGRAFDLAVRVMRATPTGVIETTPGGPGDDGIVKLADIRKRVQTFVRRCWAQSHIKPNLVLLQTRDLPSDSIAVADATGLPARGTQDGSSNPGQIGFTLSVQRFGGGTSTVHNIAPFNVPAGSTPQQTAALIQHSVAAIPGVTATVSPNPAEVCDPDGSCDVFFSEASGGRVTIKNMTPAAAQDGDQKAIAVGLTMTVRRRNGNDDYHVGHPEQRNLVKSLDTPGDLVIDVTVIDAFPVATLMGFTVPELKNLDADRRPVSGVKNSIIMARRASTSGDGIPFALAHEIGHVLTDEGRHALANPELMFPKTPVNASSTNDSKRIVEHTPATDNWEITVQHTDANRTVGGRQTRLNATFHVNNIASPHLLH